MGERFFHKEIEKAEGPKETPKEKINYEQSGLKNLKIEKPVIVPGGAFPEASGIKANRVKAMSAFKKAENCQAKKVEARDAFQSGRNCQAEKVKVTNAFWFAENCQAEKVEATDAFRSAKKCLVKDRIEAEKIGRWSRGVVTLDEIKVAEIFPSVILMKDKVKDEPLKVRKFFEKEMEKARNKKENIFDYLSYFNWEGETLEKGKEKLKGRYDELMNSRYQKFKENNMVATGDVPPEADIREAFYLVMLDDYLAEAEGISLKDLKNKYFYYLIDDNSQREEIFDGFLKLKKIEKQSLDVLNDYDYFSEFKEIKESLNVLSLKDWVKLGKYGEFLDFDKQRVQNIKNDFEKVRLEEIIKNPKEFDAWKTAGHIKQLEGQGREIDLKNLEKEFNKERKNKINSRIREYILNSPEENLKNYLKKIGWKDEVSEDIIFAAKLHKVLANKGETKNKEVLEKLLKGENPLDFKENKMWLEKMKDKLNTEKWLSHKQKGYAPIGEKDYSASLEKSRTEQLQEIVKHFKEIGIEINPEIQEIEKIFSEKIKEIPVNIRKDIKNHIQVYKSGLGIEKSTLPKKIILETEENPLKIIQMGEKVVGSCLAVRGGHEESSVCNAADINKKIIWAKDEKGEIWGRVLVGITDEGKLAHFKVFNNDPRLNLKSSYKDFISEFAGELKTDIASKGNIKELVGENWYNDGIVKL